MTDEAPMMAGSATVFVVSDVAASLAHYRDVFGFEIAFEDGSPLSYVCLCREAVNLHLLAASRTKRSPGQGGLCIFVRDVDRLYAELAERGARLINQLEDRHYGMRDFDAVDADGNQLTFGMGMSGAA
ncbi:glyoxalase superfamily protein [Bradyrhizobium sp. 930_D9_N1_4]|uniref:glyoxalase superfamily protein n=1 Tax=Bradyrhizobium sp. 930_D9_N1_4 TaxID=3240374 RepID=UPI003F88D720